MNVKGLLIGGTIAMVLTASALFVVSGIKKRNENNQDNNQDNTPNTSGSSTNTSSWVAESFPLKKNMKGENVKTLQKALGVTADGLFGSGTETALKNKYNVTECSETLFKTITATSSTTNTTSSSVVGINSTNIPQKKTKVYINYSGNVNLRSSAGVNDGLWNNKMGTCKGGGLVGEYNGNYESVNGSDGKVYMWLQISVTKDSDAELNSGYSKGYASCWVRGDYLKY